MDSKHNDSEDLVQNDSEELRVEGELCGPSSTKMLKTELKDHVRAQHKKAFLCGLCGAFLASKSNLNRHLEVIHPGMTDPTTTLKCKYCEMELTSSQLKVHLKTFHEDKNYVCCVCGRKFNYKRSRDEHRILRCKVSV